MKIKIESTTKIVTLNGIPARIWEGETDTGIPIHCYITRVAVVNNRPDQEIADLKRELQAHRPPSPEIAMIDARLIL